jgi:RNA-binding protein NOB1
VIQGAKKTGDYAVLSHPDLCVLALTYSLHKREEAAAVKIANEARFAFVQTSTSALLTARDSRVRISLMEKLRRVHL